MTTAYEIPLSAMPQTFSIQLAGVSYTLTVRWSDVLSGGGLANPCWLLDIADQTGNPILNGIPLVTGVDLLEQYGYLNFGGQLIVQSDFDPNAQPTFDNLGSSSHLYFVTP